MEQTTIVLLNPANKDPRSARVGWIVDANGCHIWQGSRTKSGYAHVWDSAAKTTVHAHVLRYRREVGPIPEGMDLDHYICDNGPRACCNPHHCRPVTRRENMLRSDSISAQNRAKDRCPKGHPLTGDNLSRHELERGSRKCLRCIADRQNARRLADPEATKKRKAEHYRRNADRLKRKAADNYAARKAAQA